MGGSDTVQPQPSNLDDVFGCPAPSFQWLRQDCMSAPQRAILAPPLRLPLAALLLAAGLAAGIMYRTITRSVTEPKSKLEHWMDQIAEGQFGAGPPIHSGEELGSTGRSLA